MVYTFMVPFHPRVPTELSYSEGNFTTKPVVNIFIFLNKNVWTPIKISLKFVPKGLINHISALVQIMAWCRSGAKPLSETMMVSLLTHIYASLSLNELNIYLVPWYLINICGVKDSSKLDF